MARNITFEPCTLVYTLLHPKKLKFDDFSLIVRSLHSYQVESIVPNPAMNNVHVKLNYQASIANAMNKLGTLRPIIGISKLSDFVKEDEVSRLEQLRQKYGIACGEVPEPSREIYRKRNQLKQRRGIFPARPSPYQKKTRQPLASTSAINEIYEEPESDIVLQKIPDAQDFPGNDPERFSENNTGDEQS